MSRYDDLKSELSRSPLRWAVTGVAGFIGSNLLEALLKLDQTVVGLDNFATGYPGNLDDVKGLVEPAQWARFHFIEGDIRRREDCERVCKDTDVVLHQAALGSVPRSLVDPVATNAANVDGFVNMLVAARDAKVPRFVYASSSSVYGDDPALPKVEKATGAPLSPYALTKSVNEQYAAVFARSYGVKAIGLRYFNVFGPRQDPNGAYAAVIPKWTAALIEGRDVVVNGDGETSRDFCYVENAVQANLLAAAAVDPAAVNEVYNVAAGERTSLNEIFGMLRSLLAPDFPAALNSRPVYGPFRQGDVRHTLADLSKARRLLGYEPAHDVRKGLELALRWYATNACRVSTKA